jgi:hypothetical protein
MLANESIGPSDVHPEDGFSPAPLRCPSPRAGSINCATPLRRDGHMSSAPLIDPDVVDRVAAATSTLHDIDPTQFDAVTMLLLTTCVWIGCDRPIAWCDADHSLAGRPTARPFRGTAAGSAMVITTSRTMGSASTATTSVSGT